MVAVDRSDETNRGDIWLYDVERGSGTRFTSAPQDESIPVWSPDGSRLAFFSTRNAPEGAVHVRSLRGGNDEVMLFEYEGSASPSSWSRDDLLVIQYTGELGEESGDFGIFSVADETFTPHLTTEFAEQRGVISPDGRLLAYQSDETGRFEVYVESFPEQAERWRVSTDGGVGPSWSRDGRELYYVEDESKLFAVSVRTRAAASSLRFGKPELLFEADFKPGGFRQEYDTVDSTTFVINRRVGDLSTAPLTLVVGASGR
jgi:hypothetical protein